MSTPLVSVIVPCFNSSGFVEEAITSALNQTYENIEVIVVDDGSADGSVDFLQENFGLHPKVKIFSHPGGANLGVSRTRKLGIVHARGEYIAYLDADDAFYPDKIAVQMRVFDQHPSVVLVHSAVSFKAEANKGKEFYIDFQSFGESRIYNFLAEPYLVINKICNSTVVVRKEALTNLENSFHQLFQYEDWINWILLAEKGKFYFINEQLAMYRYHNQSSSYSLVNNQFRKIYAKLEMLFILLSRVDDPNMRRKIFDDLDRTIRQGINSYGDGNKFRHYHWMYLYNCFKTILRSGRRIVSRVFKITLFLCL